MKMSASQLLSSSTALYPMPYGGVTPDPRDSALAYFEKKRAYAEAKAFVLTTYHQATEPANKPATKSTN